MASEPRQIDVDCEEMKVRLVKMAAAINNEGLHELGLQCQQAIVGLDTFYAACYEQGMESLRYESHENGGTRND